eukprot:66313-Pyramimonas_sp.AAC.1
MVVMLPLVIYLARRFVRHYIAAHRTKSEPTDNHPEVGYSSLREVEVSVFNADPSVSTQAHRGRHSSHETSPLTTPRTSINI